MAKPTVILVGPQLQRLPPGSLAVGRPESSTAWECGVIPGDCLPPQIAGPTSWHYPNIIMNAVALRPTARNLFLLYVSNFSCTIDAFTHSFLSSEMGDKPYLMLEIDAHTADAGVSDPPGGVLDVIGTTRRAPSGKRRLPPATIGPDGDGHHLRRPARSPDRSAGEDPFPQFLPLPLPGRGLGHAWQGLNVGPPVELDRRHLERGLRYTSGRECLPLPICLGQMLERTRRRARARSSASTWSAAAAPCVVDCYLDYFCQFIREQPDWKTSSSSHPQEAKQLLRIEPPQAGAVAGPGDHAGRPVRGDGAKPAGGRGTGKLESVASVLE